MRKPSDLLGTVFVQQERKGNYDKKYAVRTPRFGESPDDNRPGRQSQNSLGHRRDAFGRDYWYLLRRVVVARYNEEACRVL